MNLSLFMKNDLKSPGVRIMELSEPWHGHGSFTLSEVHSISHEK